MFKLDDKHKMLVKALSLVGVIVIGFYFLLTNTTLIVAFINKISGILFPFISGFGLAILLLPAVKFFEKSLKKHTKLKEKNITFLSVFIVLVLMVVVVSVLMMLIIPSLIDSILNLSTTFSSNINNSNNKISIHIFNLNFDLAPMLTNWWKENGSNLINQFIVSFKEFIPSIFVYSLLFVSRFFGFVVGIAVMVYGLLDKNRLSKQTKVLLYALLPEKFVDNLIDVSRFSLSIFNSFVVGKIIDSLIIGIICFVGMSILKMEYALLISTIVGITNIIPVFGPFIGAIPGLAILIIINPTQALIFVIWILVLQQFDGNILGPYILGDKVGLPSIWVIFAIVVGGGMGGFLGMFLGIPIFAVIYALIKKWAYKKVETKNLNHKV